MHSLHVHQTGAMPVMNLGLYVIAVYGNEQEGLDGSDTMFLVRASNYQEAAGLVDAVYSGKRLSNWVCACGDDCSTGYDAKILVGPFLGLAGLGADYNQVWIREHGDPTWRSISV